ncbi:alkaline phosphatase family protein [Pseudoblastomonas halimionae]|uniref:Uncharacterized protein n=1 Tax=Alteriqipengyuania halimionae TaxID=1926630 RepID=A0A6I4U3N3_9SPHN|nr:alkaline phosphatase family protein [Alteriqipengyuania halimionae]MXP10699.1 hypothetical protein [Alteriqipengyuania halimionae]
MTNKATPATGHRQIVLELNELCPSLLDRLIGEDLLPHFAALRSESEVWVTRPDVDDDTLLEPWIQWYSVHTGLPFDEHRVFHLTDGARAGHRDVFRMLLDAGRSVIDFGSMNVAPFADPDGVFIADPWSEDGRSHPGAFDVYARFVSENVREYSNAGRAMSAADYLRFLGFMVSHGLSVETVRAILAQLASEKLRESRLSWKRVMLLDRLNFDVFRAAWKKRKPDFATFFSNSVAHVQHSYWRHMDPAAFAVKPGPGEMALYRHAVRDAYVAMDRLVGGFRALAARHDATLIFATALSQQPFLRYEDKGGQNFYRLHDVDAFLREAGIAYREASPTMTHQYMLECGDAAGARAARKRLEQYTDCEGRQVFGFPAIESAPGALYFGCQISRPVDEDEQIRDGGRNRAVDFASLFYRIDALKSGRHHPDGCLWIANGNPRVHERRASILDILPTQLALAGIAVPEGLAGKPLLEHAAG